MDLRTLVRGAFGDDDIVSSDSFWYYATHEFDLARKRLPSGSIVGDHGPEYEYQKPSPADHEAALNCGCIQRYPVAPMDGELLYCRLHDDWYKSHPAIPREPTSYLLKCNSCVWNPEGVPNSSRAHSKAKRHSLGSKGGRINDPHDVLIGKKHGNSVEWKTYSPKKKDN